MHAFILAGGFATRLWPLTEARAKPLLPLIGKPILTHIVEKLPKDLPITVSTNAAFGDDMKQWAAGLGRNNVTVRVEETRSDDEKLGALGSVAQWIGAEGIQDDVLLLAGDNYFGFAFADFLNAYDGTNAVVAAYDIGDKTKASAFGTIILGQNKAITGFEEKPKEPKTSLVSTGASILPASVIPDLLAYAKIKPDNVGGIFEELLRLGRTVNAFTFSEPWFDVGSFESYLDATKLLVGENIVQGNGATFTESERTGSVVLGAGSTVRSSRLTDTVVFENCQMEDCVLDRCIVDDGCILKGVDLSGKMLRAGTTLILPD